MDAAKKVAIEKRVVMGLACVFVATLAMGPLKHLGWFTAPITPAPLLDQVKLTKPIGAMMQDFWRQNIEGPSTSQETARSSHQPAQPSAAYTAQNLRDPFKGLLPSPPPPEAEAGSNPAAAPAPNHVAPPPPPPPPALHVEGIVWGGVSPSAIIDGEVYGVNEMVQGVKILSIGRRGVTIEHEGKPVVYPPVASTATPGRSASWPRSGHRQ